MGSGLYYMDLPGGNLETLSKIFQDSWNKLTILQVLTPFWDALDGVINLSDLHNLCCEPHSYEQFDEEFKSVIKKLESLPENNRFRGFLKEAWKRLYPDIPIPEAIREVLFKLNDTGNFRFQFSQDQLEEDTQIYFEDYSDSPDTPDWWLKDYGDLGTYAGNFLTCYAAEFLHMDDYEGDEIEEDQLDGLTEEGDVVHFARYFPDTGGKDGRWIAFGIFSC